MSAKAAGGFEQFPSGTGKLETHAATVDLGRDPPNISRSNGSRNHAAGTGGIDAEALRHHTNRRLVTRGPVRLVKSVYDEAVGHVEANSQFAFHHSPDGAPGLAASDANHRTLDLGERVPSRVWRHEFYQSTINPVS